MGVLVKAIVEGLGGARSAPRELDMPAEAQEEMRRSALTQISAKAGSRLPILVGKDPGLPKQAPILDINLLRERNAELIRSRVQKKEA